MNFTADLISNPNYKKYKVVRGVLFVIFLFFGTPGFYMLSNSDSIISDIKEFPEMGIYLFAMIIVGITYAMVHYYSWNIKKVGKLFLSQNKIQIELDNFKREFEISDLKKISIIRNSTFHKPEDDLEKPYSGNNWIELFINKRDREKHEFSIDSIAHNEAFETTVLNLRKKYRRIVDYRSI